MRINGLADSHSYVIMTANEKGKSQTMNCIVVGFLLAASCIYEDPHNHAGGLPLAGTCSTATNAASVSADARANVASEGTGGTWDVRTASWFVLDDWLLLKPIGALLLFR